MNEIYYLLNFFYLSFLGTKENITTFLGLQMIFHTLMLGTRYYAPKPLPTYEYTNGIITALKLECIQSINTFIVIHLKMFL